MGNATWDSRAYASASSVYQKQSREQLFHLRSIRTDFDPKNITVRESCDSEANPLSTPIIVGLDVTGSMGFIAEAIAKHKLGTMVEGILDRKPVTDPHIMIMAIGDIFCDSAPLQVTQFESDIRIAEQLTNLYLEGGGGGNSYESYDLPWVFAARKTKIDSFDKRGIKGYLFTIGDENPPVTVSRRQLKEQIGVNEEVDLTSSEYLEEAQKRYNVFHIIVEEGTYAQRQLPAVSKNWKNLLGKKAIHLNDHTAIAEVIISIIEVNEGRDPDDVITSWQDKRIQKAVSYSLYGNQEQ